MNEWMNEQRWVKPDVQTAPQYNGDDDSSDVDSDDYDEANVETDNQTNRNIIALGQNTIECYVQNTCMFIHTVTATCSGWDIDNSQNC